MMSEIAEVVVAASPAVVEVNAAVAPAVVEIDAPGPQGPRGDDGWAVPIQSISSGGPSLQIDYSAGKHAVLTLTGNITTLTFANWPVANRLARLTIEVVNTGSYAITWPASVKWSGGSAPSNSLGAGKLDTFILTTVDAGATIKGHIAGLAFA